MPSAEHRGRLHRHRIDARRIDAGLHVAAHRRRLTRQGARVAAQVGVAVIAVARLAVRLLDDRWVAAHAEVRQVVAPRATRGDGAENVVRALRSLPRSRGPTAARRSPRREPASVRLRSTAAAARPRPTACRGSTAPRGDRPRRPAPRRRARGSRCGAGRGDRGGARSASRSSRQRLLSRRLGGAEVRDDRDRRRRERAREQRPRADPHPRAPRGAAPSAGAARRARAAAPGSSVDLAADRLAPARRDRDPPRPRRHLGRVPAQQHRRGRRR